MGTVPELSSNSARTAAERLGHPVFGAGIDPSAAGRRSAEGRRFAKQRQLEAKVAESRNGYALLKLAEKEARRNRALEEAQIRADRVVLRLMDDADAERATIAGLIEQTRELEAQVEALEQRKQAASSIDDTTLVELLREIGEERATNAAIALGWGDDEDETDVA